MQNEKKSKVGRCRFPENLGKKKERASGLS
jgi:hypothetical protein